jgi:hypothetical protein
MTDVVAVALILEAVAVVIVELAGEVVPFYVSMSYLCVFLKN